MHILLNIIGTLFGIWFAIFLLWDLMVIRNWIKYGSTGVEYPLLNMLLLPILIPLWVYYFLKGRIMQRSSRH